MNSQMPWVWCLFRLSGYVTIFVYNWQSQNGLLNLLESLTVPGASLKLHKEGNHKSLKLSLAIAVYGLRRDGETWFCYGIRALDRAMEKWLFFFFAFGSQETWKFKNQENENERERVQKLRRKWGICNIQVESNPIHIAKVQTKIQEDTDIYINLEAVPVQEQLDSQTEWLWDSMRDF